MRRGQHGRDTESPLEAKREIEQCDEQRDDDGDHRIAAQLTTDARADGLPADNSGFAGPEFLVQRRLDITCRALDAGTGGVPRRADGEIARTAELLNLRAGVSGRIHRRANVAHVGWLLECDLYQRAASELDAPVDAVHTEEDQACGDEYGGDADRNAPGLDEIVLGTVKDAQHDGL